MRRSHLSALAYAIAATAVALLSPTALAQSGSARTSLLQIFWMGIEIPSYLIFAGSFVVIALVVEHFVSVRPATIGPKDQIARAREQIERRQFRECLETLRGSRTFFAQAMTAGLQHARHGFDAMHSALLEKSSELSSRMFRRVEYLNVIGNLGPLLGLLGTVWGMIEAFGSLGAGGGQAGAGDLASGISKALVNTALGLALAIIGIGFYGLSRNRVDALTVAATVNALDLLEYFRPATQVGRTPERANAAEPANSGAA